MEEEKNKNKEEKFNDNRNELDVVDMLTQKLNELFEDKSFYTAAKMEGYLSKAGNMQLIAKEQIDKYKNENGITGELTANQVEEIAKRFDEELRKLVEMDKNREDSKDEKPEVETGKEKDEDEQHEVNEKPEDDGKNKNDDDDMEIGD